MYCETNLHIIPILRILRFCEISYFGKIAYFLKDFLKLGNQGPQGSGASAPAILSILASSASTVAMSEASIFNGQNSGYPSPAIASSVVAGNKRYHNVTMFGCLDSRQELGERHV